MKIGFVLDDGLDTPDGVQQYVQTLGAWMTAEGHQVHYLVGQTKRTDIPNVHSLARNISVRFNHNRLTIPLPANRSRIKKLLEKEAFDVLHVQMPYSPLLAGRIIRSASTSCAVLGTFHILPYGSLQTEGARILGLLTRTTSSRFDTIFSVSPAAKDFAKSIMGITSTVVPNVVDISTFQTLQKSKKDSTKKSIVFLGRFVERKGCMQLLRALAILAEEQALNDVQVTMCGSGPLANEAQEFVRVHSLEKLVTFTGRVTETEKVTYFAHADIAMFPSMSGESFGIVLIEAMAAGSGVVLGGNNPGYASVLTGIPEQLVDPADPSVLAAQILRVLTDKSLAQKIHVHQQSHVGQFDVDTVGRKILGVYSDAIAKRVVNSDNTTHG